MPDPANPQHPGAPDALLHQAEHHFRAALALCPSTPAALHLLLSAAHRAGLHTIAREILAQAPPGDPRFLHLQGAIERDEGKTPAALDAFARALDAAPHDAQLHADLADMLRRAGRLEDAHHHADAAIALAPHNPAGRVARANALYPAGNFPEAEAALRHALALDPHHAAAHRGLAHLLFLHGRFAEGYPHYEHRWDLPGFRGTDERLARPRWNGDPLAHRTLLLHAEQGLGDTLQMLRYLPRIPKNHGRIILQVQPPLKKLLDPFPNVDLLLSRGKPLPPFDCHAPLLSLPQLFNTSLETIPQDVPYLHVTPTPRSQDTHLHVGLAWSGNPLHPGDYFRSIPFPLLSPLFTLPHVCFHHLQPQTPNENPVPFHDLAPLIASLDLVITVDTAIAHLAGALGRPTFLLLPYAPDWRWLLDRLDSPWYPTFRLYRQPRLADWPAVIAAIRAALAHP